MCVQNIVMTVVGALAFSDFRWHPFNAAGLAISMAGAIYYATKSALRVRHQMVWECVCLQMCVCLCKRVGALAFSEFCWHPFNAAGLANSMAGASYHATKSALRARLQVAWVCVCLQMCIFVRERARACISVSHWRRFNAAALATAQ